MLDSIPEGSIGLVLPELTQQVTELCQAGAHWLTVTNTEPEEMGAALGGWWPGAGGEVGPSFPCLS